MGRIGTLGVAVWSALSAAPAFANELGSAPAAAPARAPVLREPTALGQPIDIRRLRLLPTDGRTRSHRLHDAAVVDRGDDGRLRARVRGVRVWEIGGDDAAFALGVSPVSGRLLGSLRIVR